MKGAESVSSTPSLDPRVALSDAIDGAPVEGSSTIHRHYAAIIRAHSRRFTGLDIALNHAAPTVAAVLPSTCDHPGALLRMAGFTIRQAVLSPAILADARVLVAGCSRCLPSFLPDGFFHRGGILVSSDRTILDVPLPDGVLTRHQPSPARSVPLLVHDERQSIAQGTSLAAGHIPVSLQDRDPARVMVIATDCTSGEPVVFAVRIGNGWLLHSIAHWYQDSCVPGETDTLLQSVRAMSLALLTGLQRVLSAPSN